MAAQQQRPVLEVDDHDLLGQAEWIIGGDAGRKARRQAWYAAYVAIIGTAAYGFPVIQAVFKTTDRASLRSQLSSPVAIAIGIVSIVAVLWALFSAGHFRGPVVPPLPWIDHVVSTPIDRALSVRRWWRMASAGTVFAGGLVGATLGAGAAFAGLFPWYVAGLALVVGAVVGRVAGALWLWGQVRSWPGPQRGVASVVGPRRALRAIHVETLRTHSANTSTIGGSVLSGDLRSARLKLARPVRHARHARLRPSGPVLVVARRDLLGLRRLPSNLWTGVGFTLLAVVVLAWALVNPAAPVLAAAIGLVPAYLGFGAWSEGLRLQADNAGTPSLLGLSARAEAGGHLVVPTVLMLLSLAAGLGVTSTTRSVRPSSIVLVPLLVAVLVGGQLLAAFRGTPPLSSLRPGSGPMTLIFWYLLPAISVLVVGSLDVLLVRASGIGPLWALSVTAAVVAWGFARVRKLTEAHRG